MLIFNVSKIQNPLKNQQEAIATDIEANTQATEDGLAGQMSTPAAEPKEAEPKGRQSFVFWS